MKKHKNIICTNKKCGITSMRVAIAETRVILECFMCGYRNSIWIKEFDKRGDKTSSWNNLKFSKTENVVD